MKKFFPLFKRKSDSSWKPASKGFIDGIIEIAENEMNEKELAIWEKIKLPKPEKWKQHPMGELGGGFWVIAIMGKTCIYYNDIEDGINCSKFESWGEIQEYLCNQTELHHFVSSLLNL